MKSYFQNFYFGLFVERNLPPFLESVSFQNKSLISLSAPDSGSKSTFGVVKLCPDYLEYNINSKYSLSCERVYRTEGFAINLEGVNSGEEYIRNHFKANFRKSLKRRLNGLETCFDIHYEMYFGTIESGKYDFLMQSLKQMITRRFKQRNDENMALKDWALYMGQSRELILKKEASLFVIYDGDKPIQMNLNYHFGEIVFKAVSSYDIDYSVFGLGNIGVFKVLEWCASQNYRLLDMGFGAFDYKLKWCNQSYRFEHHIFYDKSSIQAQLLRQQLYLKTRLINFLLRHRVNLFYHYCRDLLFGRKESDLRKFVSEPFRGSIPQNPMPVRVYPFQDESYFFLKKAINDFVYSQNEARTKIEVFELKKGFEYLLFGTKAQLHVLFS